MTGFMVIRFNIGIIRAIIFVLGFPGVHHFKNLFLYFTLKVSRDRLRSLRLTLLFKIESLVVRRLFPTIKIFDFIVLKVVCLALRFG